MMTLGDLKRRVEEILAAGVPENAPLIVEGYDEDYRWVQASVGEVVSEERCESDDEPPGVYLDLEDVQIDDKQELDEIRASEAIRRGEGR